MNIQIIIYFYFFIIGIVMGSFFTLATYRIPLKQDISHTRSYCPKCGHKLEFLDLIPVLSYVFLKGRCRYCHDKISPRYIVMELISGLLYLLIIMSMKIYFLDICIFDITKIVYISIMYAVIFILLGILKETRKLSKEVITFGIFVQGIYIIYLYILNINIYRHIIYLIIMCILYVIEGITRNRSENEGKK